MKNGIFFPESNLGHWKWVCQDTLDVILITCREYRAPFLDNNVINTILEKVDFAFKDLPDSRSRTAKVRGIHMNNKHADNDADVYIDVYIGPLYHKDNILVSYEEMKKDFEGYLKDRSHVLCGCQAWKRDEGIEVSCNFNYIIKERYLLDHLDGEYDEAKKAIYWKL